jgi:ankyrin repeat protein
MKQLLITIAAVVLVGCSDPEAEANKLFTEASRLVKEADAITEPNSWKAFNKRKEALELIEKITLQYPQSSLSVQISQGACLIQGQLINQVREKMKPEMSIQDAAEKGNIEVVKQHLAAGTDVNGKGDKFEASPLHLAAWEGHTEIAALLIANGADVHMQNRFGSTPLHFAAEQNNKEIVALLIANGAKVNTSDIYGSIPLHSAVKCGHKEVVELFIAKAADVNSKMDKGYTPLDVAIDYKQTEITELLRKHGGKTKKELEAAGN